MARSDLHKRGIRQRTRPEYISAYGSKAEKKSLQRHRSKRAKAQLRLRIK